jgi:hypothetical protein
VEGVQVVHVERPHVEAGGTDRLLVLPLVHRGSAMIAA